MLQQAYDFCDESNAIYALLSNIDDDQFHKSTLFKGWTFNNVIGHLHVWNYAADISLKDGEEWKEFSNNVLKAFGGGSTFSQFEETIIKDAKGKELLNIWKDYYSDMLYHALREMITEKYLLHNQNGDKGYLIRCDKYYLFQPYYNNDILLPAYYRINSGSINHINYEF